MTPSVFHTNKRLVWSLVILVSFASADKYPTLPLFHAGNGMYTVEIKIGTPPQSIMVMLDSWSADLWVPTTQSLGPANMSHSVFNPQKSSTYKDEGKNQTLPYPHTGGNSVDVAVGHDSFNLFISESSRRRRNKKDENHDEIHTDEEEEEEVHVEGYNSTTKTTKTSHDSSIAFNLGVANREDPGFANAPWDGMIGVALDGAAQVDVEGVLSRITQQAQLSTVLGIHLTAGPAWNGSQVTFGGYTTTGFYNPEDIPVYTPLLSASAVPNIPPSLSSSSSASSIAYNFWRFQLPHATVFYPSSLGPLDLVAAQEAANLLSEFSPASKGVESGKKRASTTYMEEEEEEELLDLAENNNNTNNMTTPSTENVDLCNSAANNNINCAGVMDVASGTVGIPLDLLTTFFAIINASMNGGCILERSSSSSGGGGVTNDTNGDDDTNSSSNNSGSNISNDLYYYTRTNNPGGLPWNPWFAYCPLSIASSSLSSSSPSLSNDFPPSFSPSLGSGSSIIPSPNISFTISETTDPTGNAGGTGLWDLLLLYSDYCVTSWQQAVIGEGGSVSPRIRYAPAGYCRLLLSGVSESIVPDSSDFILGAPFLRAYYAVLDADSARVGFAGLHPIGPTPSIYSQPFNAGSFWGSKEMWAIVVGLVFGTMIVVGVYYVARDRILEKRSQQLIHDQDQYLQITGGVNGIPQGEQILGWEDESPHNQMGNSSSSKSRRSTKRMGNNAFLSWWWKRNRNTNDDDDDHYDGDDYDGEDDENNRSRRGSGFFARLARRTGSAAGVSSAFLDDDESYGGGSKTFASMLFGSGARHNDGGGGGGVRGGGHRGSVISGRGMSQAGGDMIEDLEWSEEAAAAEAAVAEQEGEGEENDQHHLQINHEQLRGHFQQQRETDAGLLTPRDVYHGTVGPTTSFCHNKNNNAVTADDDGDATKMNSINLNHNRSGRSSSEDDESIVIQQHTTLRRSTSRRSQQLAKDLLSSNTAAATTTTTTTTTTTSSLQQQQQQSFSSSPRSPRASVETSRSGTTSYGGDHGGIMSSPAIHSSSSTSSGSPYYSSHRDSPANLRLGLNGVHGSTTYLDQDQ